MPLNLFNSWSQGASSGLYHDDQQCQLEACYLDDKFVASQPKGFPNKPAILTCIEKSQEKYPGRFSLPSCSQGPDGIWSLCGKWRHLPFCPPHPHWFRVGQFARVTCLPPGPCTVLPRSQEDESSPVWYQPRPREDGYHIHEPWNWGMLFVKHYLTMWYQDMCQTVRDGMFQHHKIVP